MVDQNLPPEWKRAVAELIKTWRLEAAKINGDLSPDFQLALWTCAADLADMMELFDAEVNFGVDNIVREVDSGLI